MAKYRDNIAAIKLIKQLDLEQFVNDVIAGKVTTESIDTKALDEETYAKAKPLFQQAIKNFSQAGADIKEMMRAIIKEVLNRAGKDAAVRMKPYVLRFVEDVKSGAMEGVAPPASQPSTPAIEKIKKLPKDQQKKVMALALVKARIKRLECQLNAGLDPETMLDGITIAGYHIERGVRSFGRFAQVMAEDLGTTFSKIRPYLRTWFNGGRDMLEAAGIDVAGIDGPDAVRAELARMDSQFEEQGNEPNQLSDTDLERVHQYAAPENGVGKNSVQRELGQLNSSIAPEIMQAGITLAGYHIEKGARTFAAYAKAMIEDLGDAVKPYLKSWYAAVSLDPGASGFDGMDDLVTVQFANIDTDSMTDVEKAAAEGMPEAQYELAGLHFEMGEVNEAWQWIEAASDQGFGPAQRLRAVHQDDLAEDARENLIDQAVAWYLERVEGGDAERQYEYALMHLKDEIPKASRSEGLYWLRKSAEQNYRQACETLGSHLLKDSAGDEMTQEAILWLDHAAELRGGSACLDSQWAEISEALRFG